MKKAFWLDPRDKPALLMRLMQYFAGSAHIALEGERENMETMDFSRVQGNIEGLIPPFRHEWGANGKAVVLPLKKDTIKLILDEVLPEGRIVQKVGAIQIEKDGEIVFIAGDNFHRECVSVGNGVPEQLLKEMVASGVLRGYSAAT